ncbi:MAG: hypothetical protein AAGA77_03005, partial [Bacteroidota bacterium]
DGLNALNDISALSNLDYANYVYLESCNNLTNLNGLDSLKTIGNTLTIRFNNLLTDISSLEYVDIKNMNNLEIIENPGLTICNYLSICQYFSDDGNSNIYNNDIGCNGILEIQYDCQGLLSIFEIIPTSSITGNSSDSYWHNPDNWKNNMVPVDSSYVIIPPGNITIVEQDSIASCQILNVLDDATLTIESGATLNVVDIE